MMMDAKGRECNPEDEAWLRRWRAVPEMRLDNGPLRARLLPGLLYADQFGRVRKLESAEKGGVEYAPDLKAG